jgi:hypothetical protein
MIHRGFALVAVFAAFFWGCGGKVATDSGQNGGPGTGPGSGPSDPNKPTDGSCPHAGAVYCSADPPISADDVTECDKALSDPTCGSIYKAALACEEPRITCDATNHIDSNALEDACGAQLSAYEQCVEQAPPPPSH